MLSIATSCSLCNCWKAWCKVLPDRVYKRAMGALLSLVAGKVCTPVLGATDLGEEQTHALHRIFKTLGEAVRIGLSVDFCCRCLLLLFSDSACVETWP